MIEFHLTTTFFFTYLLAVPYENDNGKEANACLHLFQNILITRKIKKIFIHASRTKCKRSIFMLPIQCQLHASKRTKTKEKCYQVVFKSGC